MFCNLLCFGPHSSASEPVCGSYNAYVLAAVGTCWCLHALLSPHTEKM